MIIGKTTYRSEEKKFYIKPDDRRRHIYCCGKTGMGKSVLLENMCIQDIQEGRGVCFIDAHGESAQRLLKAIPSNRINDTIYFNPSDTEFPIAFNPMDSKEDKFLTVSGIVSVFKKIWAESWGPRLEDTLRNTLLALLDSKSTLLGVQRMLRDESYRNKIISKVSDPIIKAFWTKTFSKWNERYREEAIAPIQNKVGQFLSSPIIRNIVGQIKTSFDFREIMDNQKILIVNLSKGLIGEDNASLLGSLITTKLYLAAMSRADIVESERNDFFLYIDECQNFTTESFANILSEARKYKLNIILANQYTSQLPDSIRDAIFGNCGSYISFRVGVDDGELLEKVLQPFLQEDLTRLEKYNIYISLSIEGKTGNAFSAVTFPPIDLSNTEPNAEKVIKASREKYAKNRANVEESITRWSCG